MGSLVDGKVFFASHIFFCSIPAMNIIFFNCFTTRGTIFHAFNCELSLVSFCSALFFVNSS